ncbi:MAG: VCBS repeat-containing protein [Candidatus Thermoplasmatota archaeon]|nr:VCBS repeat-containing protein [Candidatus Thermoplasmatota archaeon]
MILVLMLSIGGLTSVLIAGDEVAAGDDEIAQFQPLAPKPGERTGDWYIDDHVLEMEIASQNTNEWVGKQMKKLDFNGDGIEDLAVTSLGANNYFGEVYIYDGSYQVTYPNLREDTSSARWTLSCDHQGYFGYDIYIGDANGDTYDDILVGAPMMQLFNQTSDSLMYGVGAAFLYYGGPSRDGSGSEITTSNSNAQFWGDRENSYFGKAVGLGDVDGDGCDDIFISKVLCYYEEYNNYPSSPDLYEYVEIAYSYYWFGSPSFSGNHSIVGSGADFNGRITGDHVYEYKEIYLPYYIYIEQYNYFSMGNYATGDMDGDGRDEIAFGSPYYYIETYSGSGSYYIPGSVFILHPGPDIRTASKEFYKVGNTNYGKWQHYRGPEYTYSYIGYPISMYDYNMDGLQDIAIGAPYYNNMLYLVRGSRSYTTGILYIASTSIHDVSISITGVSSGGSHAFGDYDGDGKVDIAVGGRKTVYIIANKDYDLTGGKSVTASSASMLTVHAPSGSSYFADPGYMYPWVYQYYSIGFPMVFWNRDSWDACDDVFIADPYFSGQSKVYGIANYDMFGIGKFTVKPADGEGKDLFFAEYRKYGFVMSAWNKWIINGTDRMEVNMHLGSYNVILEYSKENGMQVAYDPEGQVNLDPEFYFTFDNINSEMFVHFNLTFTLMTGEETPVDVDFRVNAQHLNYALSYDEIGHLRNNFKYVGNLEHYIIKGEELVPLKMDAWVPSNSDLMFTGMKLIYDGTEELPDGPYYPRNDLFRIKASNVFGNISTDDASSGRNFSVIIGTENTPIRVTYTIEQNGIPDNKLLNSIPSFAVLVDTDWPTEPPGIQVRADAFDDPNTIVDNEGELFVTWMASVEYRSGIHHYEVIVNGDETNITSVKSQFAKIYTTASGKVNISVRAVDYVGHVGEWRTNYILIDRETLDFSDFHPGPEEWSNTIDPTVGITITDLGGRYIIGNTAEYSISHDGGLTFGEWIPSGIVYNAKALELAIQPNLMEGSGNRIKFRATDEAGNVLESDAYQVNIDVSTVGFTALKVNGESDWEGIWLGSGSTELEIGINDDFSGVDAGTIEYRMTSRGRSELNSAPWTPLEGYSNGNTVDIELDVEFDQGDQNFIQFRAQDILENPAGYSTEFNVWVNTDPIPVIISPEDGGVFSERDLITFDATGSSDPDGDTITFKWYTSIDGSDEMEVIGEGTIEDFERFETYLSPGEHNITLVAMDGLHEAYSESISIHVKEYIFPEWLTAGDIDSDGLPNWFEFEFNLGWNDPSNKDNIYIASIHSSKSKGELWELLRSEYADKKAQVTTSNDFDNDGHTDFEEYLANTDPTNEKDFPIYSLKGDSAEEKTDLLLPIAIIISVLIVILVLIVLMLNNRSVKSKAEEESAKDAENEQVLLEQAMLAGGFARLEALKAASEGRPFELQPPQEGEDLPGDTPAPEMGQAHPFEASPLLDQPMEAPAPQPIENIGGQPPQ